MPLITKAELRRVAALQDLPAVHRQRLIDHSGSKEVEDRSVLTQTGVSVDHLLMIIKANAIPTPLPQ